MTACIVYMTAGSRDEAETLARALVNERLAACVNLLGDIQSVFHWQDDVESGDEQALVAKTRQDLVPAIVDRVKALHGYECPCVVALPIVAGNPDFIAWIEAETRSA